MIATTPTARTTGLVTTLLMLVGLLVGIPGPAQAATVTISKADYYDKTLAGILGQVGGFLSGYEYASPNPYPDDSCFRPTYGPYSGDAPSECWTPNNYPGYDRLGAPNFNSNEVGSDDDYHMDFFIQHILAEDGSDPSYLDIKDQWVHHDVGDFGPSDIANDLMRNDDYMPPMTGQAEYNRHYWLTEPYIETETIGMAAPGMPETTRDLTRRFGTVVGEFDSILWGELLATMYSLAYFETDARDVLHEAVKVLPQASWPTLVYEKVVNLHGQNPTDWRWAQQELLGFTRHVYGEDNEQAIPDRNNGSLIIAILYGQNDYLETLKISSLIGNDADCTASAAAGLMGIIKGMSGTPQEFLDRIYQNGNGRYINDLTTGFPPNIKNDYPISQSWDDIAALYQSNAEAQIVANGGSVDSQNFYIEQQLLQRPVVHPINNYDFEQQSLENWDYWTPGADPNDPNAFADEDVNSQSGEYKGTIFTDLDVSEVRLFTTVRGLQAGATYEARAFVQTDDLVDFYADSSTFAEIRADAVETFDVTYKQWVSRSLTFTAGGADVEIGIHMPQGTQGWAAIDNLVIRRVTNPSVTRYEAEDAARTGGEIRTATSASGSQYVGGLDNLGDGLTFSVNVPTAGEYIARMNFANAWSGFSDYALLINGIQRAQLPFPRTGTWGQFSRNVLNVPVELDAGANTLRVEQIGEGFVEFDYLDLGIASTDVYGDLVLETVGNPSFEQSAPTGTAPSWNTWPGSGGTDADADFVESGAFADHHRLTHYKATAYEVFTSQVVSGLTNGTYTLTGWMVGGGAQPTAFLSAKNYGTSVPELTAWAPGLGWPEWRHVVIHGIQVTNGQVEIGMYSNADAGQWLSLDSVTLTRWQ